jgi:hypothetical protein
LDDLSSFSVLVVDDSSIDHMIGAIDVNVTHNVILDMME